MEADSLISPVVIVISCSRWLYATLLLALSALSSCISSPVKVLKPKGRFYKVHRPFRLAEIMSVMVKYRIEPKRMRLVQPFADKEPNMVLIEGLRGGNSRMLVEKPLIVYEKQGIYTEEIRKIYGQEVIK